MDNNISCEMISEILTNEQFWQKYQEDIEQHYNVFECQENNDKLQQILGQGIGCQSNEQFHINEGLFLALAQPLSFMKIFIQEAVLQQYFTEEFLMQFNRISNVQKQSKFFINEFMDQLIFFGLKNVKNYIKKITGSSLIIQGEQDQFDDLKQHQKQKKIIHKQFEFFLDQNNDILIPKDHQRYSSCMLIRSYSQNQNQLQQAKFQEDQEDQLHQKILEGSLISMSSDFTDIGIIKEEILKSNTLNIVQLFLGDILHHRYLQDNKYIENHLYTAQCEKYKPQMTCIYESEEDGNQNENEIQKKHRRNSWDKIKKQQKQQQQELYNIMDCNSDNEEQYSDSQQQEEEYWEQVNEYREQFQQILKKIIEMFNSQATQRVLLQIYEKIQKKLETQVMVDQESVIANKQLFLSLTIDNYYNIHKAYDVVNKIQKLVQKLIPNYNSYIDFKEFEEQEFMINQQISINLQEKNKLGSSLNLEENQEQNQNNFKKNEDIVQENSDDNEQNLIISEQDLLESMGENNISSWMFM